MTATRLLHYRSFVRLSSVFCAETAMKTVLQWISFRGFVQSNQKKMKNKGFVYCGWQRVYDNKDTSLFIQIYIGND